MGSTALQLIAAAYRQHNLPEPKTFNATGEFPLNIALDVFNQAIREMNRLPGSFWFQATRTPLSYSPGVNTWSFLALGVDPKRVRFIRRELANEVGKLVQFEESNFIDRYRIGPAPSAAPTAWTKYGDTLELNTVPDKDYQLLIYHYSDIPLVTLPDTTFNIPASDEDVLIDNCYQILGYRMGRWGMDLALPIIAAKTNPLLVSIQNDAGLPRQMPAAF